MTVRTVAHAALERVEEEREHVDDKLAAYGRFDAGVCDLEPVAPTGPAGAMAPVGGGGAPAMATVQRRSAESDGVDRVRELFAETVRPHSVADLDDPEPLLETMAEELGQELAATLAPTTPGRFTADVKGAIRSTVRRRRAELRSMDGAIDTETETLETGLEAIDEITAWLLDANEVPLLELGFEALRERHETLDAHRDRCADLVRDRQAVLHGTTGHGGTAGLTHQAFVAYLYRDLPTSYPLLTTALRLESICARCQRAARDHLTRRV